MTITGLREPVLAGAAVRIGARHVAFDAADPVVVERALPRLPERADVLVNNAGGVPEPSPGGDAPESLAGVAAVWRVMLEANLFSAVQVTAALKARLADGARIVNIGSIAARRGAGVVGRGKGGAGGVDGRLSATSARWTSNGEVTVL